MDESQKYYAKWKKSDTKDHTVWSHLYDIPETAKPKQMGGFQGLWVDGGDSLPKVMRELFAILIVVEVTQLYIFVKIHRTIHQRKVSFTMCIITQQAWLKNANKYI